MHIESLDSVGGALRAVVRFEPGEPLRTSEVPGLPGALLAALPGLKGHRCDNGAHATFPQELRDTELAHAIEHVAVEVLALADPSSDVRGRTEWDFVRDGRGIFRIALWDTGPVEGEAALVFACALVGALARGEAPPDAEREARRIQKLGRGGA